MNGTSPETPLASRRDIGYVAICSLIMPSLEPQLPGHRSTVSAMRNWKVGVTVTEPLALRTMVACTSVSDRRSSIRPGCAPTEQVVCVLPTPPARLPGTVPIVVKSISSGLDSDSSSVLRAGR